MRLPCPKCKSHSTFIEIEREPVFSCYMCGFRIYGKERIYKQIDAFIESRCAWGPCNNDKRPNSKYCSKQCSNKNARHRHKLRKQNAA